jgi:anti-sigma B factor antagonist
MSFEATTRRNGDLVVLDMDGEVDGNADEGLNGAYDAAIADNPQRVLLNFKDVSYINSTGIALIVGLLAEARRSGRAIVVCGLTDHYKEIFEITRISDFVTIVDDEAAAQAAPA